jgi:hypothetical protein
MIGQRFLTGRPAAILRPVPRMLPWARIGWGTSNPVCTVLKLLTLLAADDAHGRMKEHGQGNDVKPV